MEAAQAAERGLDALAGQPACPAQEHVVATQPGVGEGLAEPLAVLALARRRPVGHVLGHDLHAPAGGPPAQSGELVAGLLLVGGDPRSGHVLWRGPWAATCTC